MNSKELVEIMVDRFVERPIDDSLMQAIAARISAELNYKMLEKLTQRLLANEDFVQAIVDKLTREQNDDYDTIVVDHNLLTKMGIYPNIKGYHYITSALEYLKGKDFSHVLVTGELYPYVARQHETSPGKVERAIRHAIEVGKLAKTNLWMQLIPMEGKITNGAFLAILHIQTKNFSI